MNKIEEFYKEAGGIEYDKFDKKANKFTYYDMIGFADAYHSKQLNITDVNELLPNKDATICEGYNKAKMQDYKNRNVLRHKDQDDYYSGWMDCYDWISEGN